MDDFYVVLPSNTQSTIPNTPAKFLTTFSEPIHLENTNDWEVGLVEMNFMNSIKTIDTNDFVHVHQYRNNNKQPQKGKFSCVPLLVNGKPTYTYVKGQPFPLENGFRFTQPNNVNQFQLKYINKKFQLEILTDEPITITINSILATYCGFIKSEVKNLTLTEGPYVFENKTKGTYIASMTPQKAYQTAALLYLEFKIEYDQSEIIDKNIVTVVPKPGTYSTALELETELNGKSDLNKYFKFIYDPRLNRFDLESTLIALASDEYTLQLSNGLKDVLGFTKTIFKPKAENQKGELEVNLMRGITSLFVYCDTCDVIRVGNSMSPLLRNVAFNPTKYGNMVHTNYNNPIYVKVNKTFIDSIEIIICDVTGEVIPFVEGMTTLILHFKRL